jgi:hypothetical protein
MDSYKINKEYTKKSDYESPKFIRGFNDSHKFFVMNGIPYWKKTNNSYAQVAIHGIPVHMTGSDYIIEPFIHNYIKEAESVKKYKSTFFEYDKQVKVVSIRKSKKIEKQKIFKSANKSKRIGKRRKSSHNEKKFRDKDRYYKHCELYIDRDNEEITSVKYFDLDDDQTMTFSINSYDLDFDSPDYYDEDYYDEDYYDEDYYDGHSMVYPHNVRRNLIYNPEYDDDYYDEMITEYRLTNGFYRY